MKIFFDIVGEIIELLSLADKPTGYIMGFTAIWLPVLIIAAIVTKKNKKIVFSILAVIPVINFAVFYLFNYTKGVQLPGLLRFGPHLVAALVYCVAAIVMSRGKRKVLPLIISGVLSVLLSVFSVLYVFAMGSAYHYGNFTHSGYERSMSQLIDELEANYVLRDYKEIDFEYLRSTYIPMAAEAEKNKDEAAFAEAVANLCYEFHDGHLSIRITDESLSQKVRDKMAGNDYGFSMMRLDDGKTVVILCDENSEAYNLGIHNDTVITAWDGVGIDEAISGVRCVQSIAQMCAYPIESNEELVKPIFLAGQGGDKIKVRFIDDLGSEKEVTLTANGSYFSRLMSATIPLTEKWCSEFGQAKMLDDHVGYICIPVERFDAVKDLPAALKDEYPELKELLISRIDGLKAQGMDKLVIDIRGNDGGIDVVYEQVVSLFTDKQMVAYGAFYDGTKFNKSDNWAWTVPVDGRYKDIPAVVLVSAGCASSGDMLAYRLSNCPNTTMMGITTTWGSAQSLGGECILSGGHIEVRYPIIATLDEDGKIIMDAGKDRKSSLKLDKRIPMDKTAVYCIYGLGGDYEIAYARKYLNGEI